MEIEENPIAPSLRHTLSAAATASDSPGRIYHPDGLNSLSSTSSAANSSNYYAEDDGHRCMLWESDHSFGSSSGGVSSQGKSFHSLVASKDQFPLSVEMKALVETYNRMLSKLSSYLLYSGVVRDHFSQVVSWLTDARATIQFAKPFLISSRRRLSNFLLFKILPLRKGIAASTERQEDASVTLQKLKRSISALEIQAEVLLDGFGAASCSSALLYNADMVINIPQLHRMPGNVVGFHDIDMIFLPNGKHIVGGSRLFYDIIIQVELLADKQLDRAEFQVTKIQDAIAEQLGIHLPWDESKRILALHNALSRLRFLVILCIYWHTVDLRKIGIPEKSGSSKVLIISRYGVFKSMQRVEMIKLPELPKMFSFLEISGGSHQQPSRVLRPFTSDWTYEADEPIIIPSVSMGEF